MTAYRVTAQLRVTLGAPDAWTLHVEDVSGRLPVTLGYRHRCGLGDVDALVREVVPGAVIDAVAVAVVQPVDLRTRLDRAARRRAACRREAAQGFAASWAVS